MANRESVQTHEELSGMEKAAALLLIMGRESAVKLSGFFTQDEIRALTEAAGKFQTLNSGTVSQLVAEFSKNYMSMGMFAQAEKLSDIFEDLPEDEAIDQMEVQGSAGAAQTGASPSPEIEEILEFLDSEPTHIGAFLLSTLDDEFSAQIFLAMDPQKRKDLFKTYLDRNQLDPQIERVMRAELISLIGESNVDDGSRGRIESAANLINFFPEEDGEDLMDFISGQNPDTASILKKSLFKFSSIIELSKETRSLVFDAVDTDDIVKSLGGTTEEFRECVLEVLSQRNRRMVEAELARAATSEEDVQATQRKVSAVVLKLSKEGKIALPGSGEGS
ncbi:MAG: FliG C-terminal domain-containing protein [Pseudomonadota bacterium]